MTHSFAVLIFLVCSVVQEETMPSLGEYTRTYTHHSQSLPEQCLNYRHIICLCYYMSMVWAKKQTVKVSCLRWSCPLKLTIRLCLCTVWGAQLLRMQNESILIKVMLTSIESILLFMCCGLNFHNASVLHESTQPMWVISTADHRPSLTTIKSVKLEVLRPSPKFLDTAHVLGCIAVCV